MCGIDSRFHTKNWELRVNMGIMSMMFTDAWLLYKASRGASLSITPQHFFEVMACQMIDTDVHFRGTKTQQGLQSRQKTKRPPSNNTMQAKTAKKRKGHPNHAQQSRCAVCKLKWTTHICFLYSKTLQNKQELAICLGSTESNCWKMHLNHL